MLLLKRVAAEIEKNIDTMLKDGDIDEAGYFTPDGCDKIMKTINKCTKE